MGITHKNVITKTKPDVVRIIFEIVDGGWSDQRYSTPKFDHTRDHGPCIPGKPDVVDDTLAIYIIVHNIVIVY